MMGSSTINKVLPPLAIAGLLALACDFWSANPLPVGSPIDTPVDTLVDCDEADRLAVWLSGAQTAPRELSQRIRADLEMIRVGWGDSVPEVAIQFSPPWMFSELLVGVTEATWTAIRNHEYTAWNDLNEHFYLSAVDSSFCALGVCAVNLSFAGCQHSLRLARAYDTLPGFVYSEAAGFVGDGPKLLVHDAGPSLVYFFRNAWGDCPAGCIHSTYDIFSAADGSITFVGHFGDGVPPLDPWASWLAAAWDRYRSWD